jgi:hypothetical protein
MIGCCCTDEPCCAQRLFREDGKNLPKLTLTLESRQRWQAFSIPGCSPLTVPPTTTITRQDITLTYANPVPSAFLSGAGSGSWDEAFFTPAQGWYLGPSVTLWAVSGDPVWTGSKTTITGKYFFHKCRLGIWFDSDKTIATDTPGVTPAPEWQAYVGLRECEWDSTGTEVTFYYGHAGTAGQQRGPQYSLRTNGLYEAGAAAGGGAVLRGYIIKDFTSITCRPLLTETEAITQALYPGTATPCDGGGSPSPGRNLAPMRLQETYTPNTNSELNPLNTNMGSVSSTPPSAVLALESTHYVEEQFHMLFTISEP